MLLIVSQAFFMYKGIENIPFFLYDMFSFAHQPRDSFQVYLLKIPKGYINTKEWSGREEEILMNNISYYEKLQKGPDFINSAVERRFRNRFPEPMYNYLLKSLSNEHSAVLLYPGWWKKYYAAVEPGKYKVVQVVKSYVSYSPGLVKSPVDSVIFTAYLK